MDYLEVSTGGKNKARSNFGSRMGRKKVELKRIEKKICRQITFSKRRNGVIEKARDLSALCDVQVALLIFSSSGKLYEFSSAGSLAKILKRHRSYFEEKTALSNGANGANDAELYHGKYENKIKSFAELLQTVQRYVYIYSIHRQVGNSNFEELTLSDLEQTEMQLDAALRRTRARKTQLMLETINALHDKTHVLLACTVFLSQHVSVRLFVHGCNAHVSFNMNSCVRIRGGVGKDTKGGKSTSEDAASLFTAMLSECVKFPPHLRSLSDAYHHCVSYHL
ncbi:hypothetical protein POTOM_014304 [Populus tomentosa]|uniref:MADS-box domain-containing protein n=1 Tax=Populus tomentosa TaxID=118781 RepID=A0A8X8D7Q0_POPTO|nr:hypothetical protein POTOM_014304 [Populus tomentosa]